MWNPTKDPGLKDLWEGVKVFAILIALIFVGMWACTEDKSPGGPGTEMVVVSDD